MDMKIDGACLCGQVRYEATVDTDTVRICHCTQCQESSASAFRTGAVVPREQFRLTRGELKFYVKTAESGRERALGFCANCGTSIYGYAPEDPRNYSLRIGTARQRAELVPRLQMWHRSALPWLPGLQDIPSIPTSPAAAAAAAEAAGDSQ